MSLRGAERQSKLKDKDEITSIRSAMTHQAEGEGLKGELERGEASLVYNSPSLGKGGG